MSESASSGRISRRWLYIAWIAGGMIFAGYYGLWRYAAGEIEKSVHDWVADQRAAGLEVKHGLLHRDGFPFFLRIHIDDPKIAEPSRWAWTAERLTLDALPYDLNKLIFTPSGAQTFEAPETGAWAFQASDIRASIANDKTRGWSFSMNVADFNAARNDGSRASLQSLVYDLAPEAEDPASLTLVLEGAGLVIDAGAETTSVDRLQTVMTLTQSPLFSAGGAHFWAANGGAIEIAGLNAIVNDADLSLAGSVSLDAQNRPAGALRAEIAKPAGLAALLKASGTLSSEEAEAAVAGLALAAIAGGGRIAAPIKLHDGAAAIAGVRIAELPAIGNGRFEQY